MAEILSCIAPAYKNFDPPMRPSPAPALQYNPGMSYTGLQQHEPASSSSSDLHPLTDSSLHSTPKSAQHQIESIQLYKDVSVELLKQAESSYGDWEASNQVWVDLLVGDLQDREIDQERLRHTLTNQIARLRAEAEKKRSRIEELNAKRMARDAINRDVQVVYSKANTQTENFMKYIEQQPIRKPSSQQQAIGIIKQVLRSNSDSLQLQIQEQQSKNQQLQQRQAQLQRAIAKMCSTIEQRKIDRRQQLINQLLFKQQKQIDALKQSIRKMNIRLATQP